MPTMYRIILVYGLIAGACVALPMLAGMLLWGRSQSAPQLATVISYLSMAAAMLVLFFGIRAFRTACGGTIKYIAALVTGLGISVVAAVVFAVGWELAIAMTGIDLSQEYAAAAAKAIAEEKAKGVTPERIAELEANVGAFVAAYSNPAVRMADSFLRIFPLGAVVSLFSGALLISPGLMPSGWRPKFKPPRWMGPRKTG